MTTLQRLTVSAALGLALVLAGCARGKDEQLAYDVCLAAAKKDAKFAQAVFASKEQSNIQASTGDSGLRVNIPYELDGKKGLYQCIADKQNDGSYKVTF
jgi:outer membrane murein-binding lipoprotein Lpp